MELPDRFTDRQDAGRQLADRLETMISGEEAVILALPRGGVPVAHEVSARVGAPLDILLVRKLGVPWQPELAFGAIATGGVVVLNEDHVRALGLGDEVVGDIFDRERLELERRERLYRDDHEPVDISGKTVVVIDDRIATCSGFPPARSSSFT
jgi:putative phosphoribosyl transferase